MVSYGKKVIMALTGLFLISFLAVHLAGNLQLLSSEGGQAFNEYAYFMTHNPVIKFTSYGLYAFILIHAIQGIALWLKNKSAREQSIHSHGRARYDHPGFHPAAHVPVLAADEAGPHGNGRLRRRGEDQRPLHAGDGRLRQPVICGHLRHQHDRNRISPFPRLRIRLPDLGPEP